MPRLKYVANLDRLGMGESERFGGKNASLGEMIGRLSKAGIRVPGGFASSADAYREFIGQGGLKARIEARLNGLDADDVEALARCGADIRGWIEATSFPKQIEAEISQAYRELTGGDDGVSVAVRSSATAEDLPDASFAGQQETYLNVRGEQALLQAVKRCWASLWTPRALTYRARQGIDPATVSEAVVAQVLVPADASGVLFTANPLTGARDEIVIDAAWGLGEAIVSGLVTPDHLIADKATGTLKQVAVADKTVMTALTSTGTQERAVEANKRSSQVLDAAQVAQLARLGSAIEAHYHTPQDIEWCLAGDQFWIVQSRPITTLPNVSVHWESPVPGAKWFKHVQAAEWATEPLSPLGATTTFATMIDARQRELPSQRVPWSALVNGWLYMRADFQVLPLAVRLVGIVLSIPAGTTLNGHRRVLRRWPEQVTMLDALERTDPSQLADASLQAHVDRLLGALGWWWWEVSWGAALAALGEQLIGKL